ncbi:MAG: hemerythrin family protein [Chlorobi bacterium]|nr:hemerythrin family protein [Chlorobiota bacterium]
MEFIKWSKAVELNIPILDKQHKKMVNLTNQLHKELELNKKTQIKKTLKLIVDELKNHFETEENLIDESKLPNFISHKLEHQRFYNKVSGLYQNIKAGKSNLTVDDLKSVKVWFFNHLDFKDKKLAEHILSKK